jgi:hypothetical protein
MGRQHSHFPHDVDPAFPPPQMPTALETTDEFVAFRMLVYLLQLTLASPPLAASGGAEALLGLIPRPLLPVLGQGRMPLTGYAVLVVGAMTTWNHQAIRRLMHLQVRCPQGRDRLLCCGPWVGLLSRRLVTLCGEG